LTRGTQERSLPAVATTAGQARALLDAYEARPYDDRDRASTHPEGRAILGSPPPVQVAVIREALERVAGSWSAQAPGAVDRRASQRRGTLLGVVAALLRRRQPFTPEDLHALLRQVAERPDPWAYPLPTLAVVRAVAAHTARRGLAADDRRLLERLRTGAAMTRDVTASDRRKAQALLDGLLGPAG
jgi:hypothetical protein